MTTEGKTVGHVTGESETALIKQLHTHRTFTLEQVDLNAKAPTWGLLQSPLTDSNR
jgi:hypothetical protein